MSEEIVLEVVEEVPKKVDKSKVVLDEPIVRTSSSVSSTLTRNPIAGVFSITRIA